MNRILGVLMAWAALASGALGQPLPAKEVPAKVREAFQVKFPSVDKVEWKLKSDKIYEAEFTLKDVEIAAQFDDNGKWLETETAIEQSALSKEVVATISKEFKGTGLVTDSGPIVAVNSHAGNPHYEPIAGKDAVVTDGSFVLIDLWAKCDRPRAVYSDLTRTAFAGREVPAKVRTIFEIVARGRDAAIATVQSAFADGRALPGWQVDKAARDAIEQAGYGAEFCHRTGHSIGQEVHGNGANMDGLETREERRVLRRTCFSIEPGIYLAEFGIRSEVDVFVDGQGQVHVTGGDPQTEVPALLA